MMKKEKDDYLATIYDDGITSQISLFLKNIGMNTVRDCYIEIASKDLKKQFCCRLEEQGCIDKGDEKNINYLLSLSQGDHIFEITIYYEDLFHNWYSQKIGLLFSVSNVYHNGINQAYINFEVYD